MVDATLLDESGSPLVEYRGIDGEPANLNTAYTEGSVPPLLPLQEPGKSGPAVRLTPVNVVSRWYWTSGDSQEPITREVLQQALMVNGQLPAGTCRRSGHEPRRQIGPRRTQAGQRRQTPGGGTAALVAAGVKNPTIRADVKLNKISHGVAGRSQALSDCAACHGPDSRLKDNVLLASWAPGGPAPAFRKEGPGGRAH